MRAWLLRRAQSPWYQVLRWLRLAWCVLLQLVQRLGLVVSVPQVRQGLVGMVTP